MAAPKYDTLAQLRDAYATGTVTAPLRIDNDEVFAYDETTSGSLFCMHPYDLLLQALDLLGIPYEGV